MKIDRVHFYVEDAKAWRDWFVRVMGFQAIASGNNSHTQTEVISSFGGEIDKITPVTPIAFVLSSPLTNRSPVAEFLNLHPPGIADVAFLVDDLPTLMARAVSWGAKIREPLQQWQSEKGRLRWSKIVALTGLHHTLIERTGKTPCFPDNWIVEKQPATEVAKKSAVLLTGIDHLVLNVAAGELEPTVRWYEGAFGFQRQQAFTIQTPQSGLYSEVLRHPVSGLHFPVNEPSSANSQIQEFLDLNQGPGIQHIALKTNQIVAATKKFKESGLSFLKTPANYYYNLQEKYSHIDFYDQQWQEILREGILVDVEGEETFKKNEQVYSRPLLLQIFSEPIFSQPTFFFELIERRNRAKGFGEGNFQALFEAIEREQLKRV